MGRGKLRMELIKSEKARKLAFEKRKRGLERAANELSTLCGVDIAMIINDANTGSNGPTIWPRGQESTLERLIDSYKSRSGNDCRYGTYNLAAYFKDQTEKIEDELHKLRKMNKEAKYPKWDDGFETLSQDDLKAFVGGLTAKIASARERINLIKESTRSRALMLVESSGGPVVMKPQVQETQSTWRFEQPPAALEYYYHDWSKMGNNQMMMMRKDGASCSQGPPYIFDQNPQVEELPRSTWRRLEQQPTLEYWSNNMGNQRMTMNNAASCSRGPFDFDHNQDQRTTMMINDAPSCSWGPYNFDLDPNHLFLL